ncbi:hypothetical protein BDR03DRAFT_946825 [Suillus americanus]|nr:hypothetical protein BDR03DRAFT_946825 [Suillus americanus]
MGGIDEGYVLGVLVCAALTEGYILVFIGAAPLSKYRTRVFMWHDNIRFTRQVLFLLPILTRFLTEVQYKTTQHVPRPSSRAFYSPRTFVNIHACCCHA